MRADEADQNEYANDLSHGYADLSYGRNTINISATAATADAMTTATIVCLVRLFK
jgi:hypothetical protein